MEWIFRVVLAMVVVASSRLWWPRVRGLRAAFRARRVGESVIGLIALGAVLFVAIQWVPFGWTYSNPPITAEPTWDSPATRDLAVRACFACHSNETQWHWYTRVAPASWLAANDVIGGRGALNFSEWDQPSAQHEARGAAREVEGGGMPPLQYTLLHAESRLNADEQAALAAGLRRSIGAR